MFVLIQGPLFTRSGYGNHCADIVKSIIKKYPNWEIKIAPTGWGVCPLTEYQDDSEESKKIRSLCLTSNLSRQPDLFIQVSVPNEFQRVAKYNIGITAGIETTICDASWIEGCNRMDLIIVPSKFSKDIFLNTKYNRLDDKKNVVGSLEIERPIEVLFEGVDIDIFKLIDEIPKSISDTINEIPEKFAFLYVGHWLKGDFGHDRKDVSGLIQTFYKSFANQQNKPALVLKTSGATFSVIDREETLQKINTIKTHVEKELNTKDLPNIYLLHGDLSPEELNGLYNHPKIKAMVSFTKGEGFGRPLLEFTMSKKPVIASNWSGQLDFLTPQTAVLLPGKIQQIHPSAVWEHVIIPESGWFYVDYETAKLKLIDIFEHYGQYDERSRKQYNHTIKNFTLDMMADKMVELFDRCVPKFAETVPLNLPKLNLPKLKRIGDV